MTDIRVFTIIAICFFSLFGCAPGNTSAPSFTPESHTDDNFSTINQNPSKFAPPIYFVVNAESGSRIWQILPDKNDLSMLYEIGQKPDESYEENLPAEEVEMLRVVLEELSSLDSTEISHTVVYESGIGNLTLSPTKEILAWTQSDGYCIRYTGVCAGESSVFILDLMSGDAEEILNIPLNRPSQISDDIFFINGKPTWSPNGQYMGILLREDPKGEDQSLAVIVDVNTKEIEKFEEGDSSLIWSSDSQIVGWRKGDGVIQFCNVDSKTCRDIELPNFDVWKEMDWEPKGNRIVYTDSGVFNLNLLDANTGITNGLVKMKGYLENPRWSPDGQLIAADYRTNLNDYYQSLLIIDANLGQVINQLDLEHSESEWVWSSDSQGILLLTGNRVTGYGLGVFDIHNEHFTPLMFPIDFEIEKIRYPTW